MPRFIIKYVRIVDAVNYRLGRIIMYGIFLMIGVLLWSSISKTFFVPASWTLEIAQFSMVAYYILGGPYSIQMGANVRMDLFYGSWTISQKAWMDALTVMFLLFYLGVLLYGAVGSTAYSLGYFGNNFFVFYKDLLFGVLGDALQGNFSGIPETVGKITGFLERSPTAWRPFMWPIKVTASIGLFLMLLQALSEFFKDIATIRGVDLRSGEPTAHLNTEN